jgi:DNA-binding NarL/FixJ family response regulator
LSRSFTDRKFYTRRQHQIADLVYAGLSNKDIAKQCGITLGTVKWHIGNIYLIKGVDSRCAFILKCHREGV